MATAVLRGRWPWADLRVTHAPSSRTLDPVVEDLLDRTFAELCATTTGLTDGDAYRAERVTAHDGGLDLVLAEERYRTHAALKLVHDDPRVRPEHHDRVLVPDALVTTADGHAVLVRTTKPTGMELQLVGGTATPGQQVIDSASDLAAFVLGRVERSLPSTAGLAEVGDVLGVVEHHVGCVNLVVEVRVHLAAGDVSGSVVDEPVVVPLDGLAAHLRAAPGYLPAVADLL